MSQKDLKTYIEIQKYINLQWVEIRHFLDSLDAFQLKPRLNLYSKIDSEQMLQSEICDKKLKEYIDFNEKLQQQYSFEFPNSSIVNQELCLHSFQLRIAHTFNTSLHYRRQRNFQVAVEAIDKGMELIDLYEKNHLEYPIKGFKSVSELKGLAYYHKAKIHRMLAGYDLDHLDAFHLCASRECYLKALELHPNSAVIHSSLGFLYIDMGKSEESIYHHERANELHPNFPDYIHGLAYALFIMEKQKVDRGESFNRDNLIRADDYFKNAIRLFTEYQSTNSRVFLDRGKLKLFMGETEEALSEFNKGLALEPYHSLLLLERGKLLATLGYIEEALNDLQTGVVVNWADTIMQGNYRQEILRTENLTNTQQTLCKKEPLLREWMGQDFETRARFETVLNQCAGYAKKKMTCFISYAWNNPDHEAWVSQFAEDLEKAGFNIILDRWFTRKGHETWSFIEKMLSEETDYILVVGTKLYLQKYKYSCLNENDREHVVKIEARLINHLMGYNQIKSDKVIPILIEGKPEESLPPFLHCKNIVDFTHADYPQLMFELIRDLYKIDQRDKEYIQLIQEY